jgi:hypothetical protein
MQAPELLYVRLMPRKNHDRTVAAPVMVRLSPAERRQLEEKAARAGLILSEAARLAFAAWDPDPKPVVR